MQLVNYRLGDIDLMMLDMLGKLYCTTPQLEMVFKCKRQHLWEIAGKWHKDEFSETRLKDLTSRNPLPKEVLESMLIERARADSRLWTEDDVLGFAFVMRSDIAKKCRAEFKEILKQHAKRGMVTKEMFENITSDMQAQISNLTEAFNTLAHQFAIADGQRTTMASNAGRSLRSLRNEIPRIIQ